MKPIYINNNVSLYCNDCIEVLKDMVNHNKKVNKVITSPPYNIIRSNISDRGYDIYKDDNMSNEDYIKWVIDIFNLYDKVLDKNGCVIWNMSYGSENTELMSLCISEIIKNTCFTIADILVWKKGSARPNNVSPNKMTRICEFVYVLCRREEFGTFTTNKKVVNVRDNGQKMYENVFNFFTARNNDGSTNLNYATFSSEFVYEIMNRYVLPTDVVMDNFSGTGTTMVCCDKRNVKGVFVELSEAQCKYSIDRLNGRTSDNDEESKVETLLDLLGE